MSSTAVMARGHMQFASSLPPHFVAFSLAHVSAAGLRACP
jgi:hypothetical protein